MAMSLIIESANDMCEQFCDMWQEERLSIISLCSHFMLLLVLALFSFESVLAGIFFLNSYVHFYCVV